MIERRKKNLYVALDRRKQSHNYESRDADETSDTDFVTGVIAAEAVSDILDLPNSNASTPDPPSSDFGGFDGGSSGGGGADGSW